MMIYIERMSVASKLNMAPDNWAILILGALIVTSKVWDDLSIWNVDFCSIFRELSVDEMNILERFYLSLMEYNVSVKSSLFAKKFFDLRDFATINGSAFDLKALSKGDAKQLESQTALKTKTVQEQFRNSADYLVKGMKKSKSENLIKSQPTNC